MSSRTLLSLSIVCGVSANLQAQQDCGAAVRATLAVADTLARASIPASGDLFWLSDSVTRSFVLERLREREDLLVSKPLDYPPVRSRLLPEVLKGPAERLAVAEALTALMRGEGHGGSSEQGYFAAQLYPALDLPFQPAAVLLSDPRADGVQRWRAALALKAHAIDARYPATATAALCEISAKTDGLAAFLGPSPRGGLLNTGEEAAVGQIMLSLGVRADSLHARVRLRDILPDSSPLARYLQSHYPSLW